MKIFCLIIIVFYQIVFSPVLACTHKFRLSMKDTIIQSDAIIVATVIDVFKSENESNESEILFEVDEVVYGKISKQAIILKGKIVSKTLGNKGLVPYENGRRRNSRGMCGARDYEYGSSYLLMLKENSPYWSGKNPTNEKVVGNQDPWLMWVKGFVAGKEFEQTK